MTINVSQNAVNAHDTDENDGEKEVNERSEGLAGQEVANIFELTYPGQLCRRPALPRNNRAGVPEGVGTTLRLARHRFYSSCAQKRSFLNPVSKISNKEVTRSATQDDI